MSYRSDSVRGSFYVTLFIVCVVSGYNMQSIMIAIVIKAMEPVVVKKISIASSACCSVFTA